MKTMEYIDTHCHLDFPVFDPDREEVILEAVALGVGKFIIPGTRRSAWQQQLAICKARPARLFAAFGCHPYFTEEHESLRQDEFFRAFRVDSYSYVAIGETGIDGRYKASLPEQLRLFDLHIQLALAESLPLIVHAVHAHHIVLEQVRRYPGLRGVIHGFSGSVEVASDYIRLGFLLGVGGLVTNLKASKMRHALAGVPLQSLLLETDSPDMPITGSCGRNTPAGIPAIFAALAALRQESEETVAQACYENSCRLFKV
jgi:TatD DNase family protein